MHPFTCTHQTALGRFNTQWTSRGLFRIEWYRVGQASEQSAAEPTVPAALTSQIVQFDELLQEYAVTGAADFHRVGIDCSGWTEFSRRIYECCRQIEPGETLSYKQLARRAGNERASRAVGTAMRKNRLPLVIPCHRVIASGGAIGGYSAPGGLETKRLLLKLECSPLVTELDRTDNVQAVNRSNTIPR